MPGNLKATTLKALRWAATELRKFAHARPTPGPEPISFQPRLGLALGGGFARGVAHIGVLKVLAANHIPIHAVAGCSVGSIVGAAWAGGASPEEMTAHARTIRWKAFARWTINRLGLATNERMDEMLRRMLSCTTFEQLSIPLAVIATDISTGEPVVFRRGDLINPVRASCSFPGLFTPVEYQGRLLVDGAIVGGVPVAPLRELGLDKIIAVSLKMGEPSRIPTNLFQVIGQAFQIALSHNATTWSRFCDVVIEPDVSEFQWDDFQRVHELVSAGERAALEALPSIRALFDSPAVKVAEPALVKGV